MRLHPYFKIMWKVRIKSSIVSMYSLGLLSHLYAYARNEALYERWCTDLSVGSPPAGALQLEDTFKVQIEVDHFPASDR